MRKTFLLLLLTVFCLTCQSIIAQGYGCTPYIVQQTVPCSTSAGCSGTVTMATPDTDSPYGAFYRCVTVSCCGVGGLPYCYYSFTGNCSIYYAKLNQPGIYQKLLDISRTQDLMIISCSGNYHPFIPFSTENSLPIEDRHILRGISRGGE